MGHTKASFYLVATSIAFLGAGVVSFLDRLTGSLSLAPTNNAASRNVAAASYDELGNTDEDIFDPLSIAPGELPGYTGWARPERTLAGQFRIDTALPLLREPVLAGDEWHVDVRCASSDHCPFGGGSHFYLRAYGPAVITGIVADNGDGSYRMSFYPVDPGRYTVEAVLTFSRAPPFEDFPLAGDEREPGYEGYLLPGFPLCMTVTTGPAPVGLSFDPSRGLTRRVGAGGPVPSAGAPAPPPARRWCSLEQLVEMGDSGSALRSGRWKVVDRVQSGRHRLSTDNPDDVDLSGYRDNINSLGIVMRYVPNACDLLPPELIVRSTRSKKEHVLDRCLSDVGVASSARPADMIHIILIGDSVMRLQDEALRLFLKGSGSKHVRVSRINMYGGISRTLSNVTTELTDIYDESPSERRFVVFNSALHDVDRLCSSEMRSSRKRHFPNMTDDDFACVQFYEKLLEQLVEVIREYPAELKLFRTVNAAWPKYGNYGFAWPTTKVQPFSRSPNFVSVINDIGYSVLGRLGRGKIQIVDGYWITLARSDHTEVGAINTIGKHMVHPGIEVINAMTMKIFMVVLRHVCSHTLDHWDSTHEG